MDRKKIGRLGEELAACYLEGRGHSILERNFRCKSGEIDIISLKDEVLHFVEVKTRTSGAYGLAEEAVGRDKLEHLKKAAQYYIMLNRPAFYREEIDVITINTDIIEGVEI